MKTRDLVMRALALFIASALVFSCTQDEVTVQENDVPDEILTALSDLGFAIDDIARVEFTNPLSGIKNTEPTYMVEQDLMLTESQIAEMLLTSKNIELPNKEQYRTSALVGGLPRTISVLGYTGSCCALTSKMRTALQWAVNNYNRINTGLTFTLTYGSTNWQSYDMVVYNNGASGGGGSAGFPSGGDPHQLIQINAGTDAFSTNVNEHVITHEMGHCLGLRHTDYFNRSLSCGSGGNEGSGGVGAIHIPGTPTGTDYNSIMQACFSNNEDGEFGSNDVIALEYLY
ncbi:MAG: zinc-dependent metalloprotease [bacterium]|nr:zinc-dependent metalloprotease [bacterium]